MGEQIWDIHSYLSKPELLGILKKETAQYYIIDRASQGHNYERRCAKSATLLHGSEADACRKMAANFLFSAADRRRQAEVEEAKARTLEQWALELDLRNKP